MIHVLTEFSQCTGHQISLRFHHLLQLLQCRHHRPVMCRKMTWSSSLTQQFHTSVSTNKSASTTSLRGATHRLQTRAHHTSLNQHKTHSAYSSRILLQSRKYHLVVGNQHGTSKASTIPIRSFTRTAVPEKAGASEITFENLLGQANRQRVLQHLETVKPVRTLEMMGVKKVKRVSAVLVPLCTVEGEPSVLLTLRSSSLRKHRGEVSFPGGNQDESDPDHVHTALRETFEETGLNPRDFDVWGVLPPTPSSKPKYGGVTYPVLACCTKELDLSTLNINTDEVEEVFTISVRDLCGRGVLGVRVGSTQFRTGPGYTMPVFLGSRHKVWGLSAIILHQVLTLIAPAPLYTFAVKHVR